MNTEAWLGMMSNYILVRVTSYITNVVFHNVNSNITFTQDSISNHMCTKQKIVNEKIDFSAKSMVNGEWVFTP